MAQDVGPWEFEGWGRLGVGGWEAQNRVTRAALPIHLFLIYSLDGTNKKLSCCYGSRDGSLRDGVAVGGWKVQNRVPREALPIHLFRHFCCRMYVSFSHNILPGTCTSSQTDRQIDRQSDTQTTVSCQYAYHTACSTAAVRSAKNRSLNFL